MTVYESVAKWLNAIFVPTNGFEAGLAVIIDVEIVPNFRDQFPGLNVMDTGLFSNPNDQHFQMLGGQHRHVEFKTWHLWREFADFDDRLANEVFLANVRRAVQRAALNGDMPKDGRRGRKIQVNGGMFPSTKSADNTSAVYQIPLKIEYVE